MLVQRNFLISPARLRRGLLLCSLVVLLATAAWPQSYVIQTFAGGGEPIAGPALLNRLTPYAIAVDQAGKVYVALSSLVVAVDQAGNLSRTAGQNSQGYGGDGGPASASELSGPSDLATDPAGNLYIYDSLNYRIREVDAQTGIIQTVAGNGTPSLAPITTDGEPAINVELPGQGYISVGPSGELYIYASCQVRKIDASSGRMVRVAGTAECGYSDNGGQALQAQIAGSGPLTFDQSGNLFIAEGTLIQRIDAVSGIITTVAGGGAVGNTIGDGGPASAAQLQVSGVAVDSRGNIYIADAFISRIREVDAASGIINTIAGTGSAGNGGYSGDNGPAVAAQLNEPRSARLDSSGALYFADFDNQRVRRIDPVSKIITTVAGDGSGNYSGDGGPASGSLVNAYGVALDYNGNVYIADTYNNRVRKVDAANGSITTVAGDGSAGFSGDGGPAVDAALNQPRAVVTDAAGNLYIADTQNARVRRVDSASGIVTTYAGGGSGSIVGGPKLATSVQLGSVYSVCLDNGGNLYLADAPNGHVYKVDGLTRLMTLVAGAFGVPSGVDGAPATSTALRFPQSIALNSVGDLFIADELANNVRRVDAVSGIITTVLGTGSPSSSGDGGPAVSASVDGPSGVAVDAQGNLYVSDSFGNLVRRVDGVTQTVSTIAGTGTPGFSGDGGLATLAGIFNPQGLAAAQDGSIYLADADNLRIRRLAPITADMPVVSGVVNAANFATTLSPGSWVAIFGLNLALTTRGWNSSDFTGSGLPTALDGVSVTVGGLPAAVSYISPGQINIQCPDTAPGPAVQIQVTTGGRVSNAFQQIVTPYEPALFAFSQGGGIYVAAVHADGTLVGSSGLFGAIASRPAAPGETIELYGTGFGPTNPVIPAGILPPASEPLANPVSVSIGGVQAQVRYSGVVEAGLDQINVTVPLGLTGDLPVLVSVNGVFPVRNQTWLLTVQQ
jgi:trimeric autotransporter adhesin